MPWLASASASVFVRTGSGHESARLSGISHVVEHMAFKGTTTRDAARINIDAERLGAEVNAHTDKDHTAYHLSGMARDAVRVRAHAGRHRAPAHVPRGRTRARAPGDPAGIPRGRGRPDVDRVPPVRQALLRRAPDGAGRDRHAPQHRALHARRPAGLRRAAVQRRQRGGGRGRQRRPRRHRARGRGRVRRHARRHAARDGRAHVAGRREGQPPRRLQPEPRRAGLSRSPR